MNRIAAMQARSGTVRGATAGGWGQQRADALPQLVGQQTVSKRSHAPKDPKPAQGLSPGRPRAIQHPRATAHPSFGNVLLSSLDDASG
jgi:hypothetical protein